MYTLYNKRLGKLLTHPRVGIWFTPDKKEAIEMLEACQDTVRQMGAHDLLTDFHIATLNEECTISSVQLHPR